MHKKTARDFPCEERWLEYISIYTTDIRHIVKRSHNVVADALSRHLDDRIPDSSNFPPTNHTLSPEDLSISPIFSNVGNIDY